MEFPVHAEVRAMAPKMKSKYLTKTVKFGSQTLTMYSIDGATWSTRKDELETIKDRHEQEKVTFAQIKGEGKKTPGAAPGEVEEPEKDADPVKDHEEEVEEADSGPTELFASDEIDDDEESDAVKVVAKKMAPVKASVKNKVSAPKKGSKGVKMASAKPPSQSKPSSSKSSPAKSTGAKASRAKAPATKSKKKG